MPARSRPDVNRVHHRQCHGGSGPLGRFGNKLGTHLADRPTARVRGGCSGFVAMGLWGSSLLVKVVEERHGD